ncbi:GNAT family N-acetyltransferase [Desertimonas flava]|uniref:GNAT family N-acetyltransferase n=1 Tax=Desertimonas flava TaxID=2064846 RepID=UPI000E34C45F|nr:GNAT family N-acetyltransferase [Desertimonas flava]
MIEIRVPTPDDYPGMVRQVRETFGGNEFTDEVSGREKNVLDFDRYRVAYDTRLGRIVGTSGTEAFEVTLPGGATLPMGGLTWVAVSPAHRRQGILTRMLDAIHADVDARGEPLGGLYASEATIYGRFGYAVATWRRTVRFDKRMGPLADHVVAPRGSIRLLSGDDPALVDELEPRWDRYRLGCVGELSRSRQRHEFVVASNDWDTTYALHDDGYAAWKITPQWNPAPPHHELRVLAFAASTTAASNALLATIASLDLVGDVVMGAPLVSPLPYLFQNSRLVHTERVEDAMWLRVNDVARVFGARTYGTDDDLVVDVDGTRWSMGGSGCSRTRKRADLMVSRRTLASLVLGGHDLQAQLAAGRIEARSADAARRAVTHFVSIPEPFCQTSF